MTSPVLWSCCGDVYEVLACARSCDFWKQAQDFNEGQQCLDHEEAGEKGLWRGRCYFSKYSDNNREALWPWLTGRKGPGQLHQLLWAPTHELCWGPEVWPRSRTRDLACQWEDIVFKKLERRIKQYFIPSCFQPCSATITKDSIEKVKPPNYRRQDPGSPCSSSWGLKNNFIKHLGESAILRGICTHFPVHYNNYMFSNQPWIFIGRTEAEVPTLWLPDAKSQLIGKDLDVGKDWGKEEKGVTEDEMVRWHHQLMDISLSKLQDIVKDREAWPVAVHGVTNSRTWLSNWTNLFIPFNNPSGRCYQPQFIGNKTETQIN